MKKLVKKAAMLVAAIAITAGSFAPLANAAGGGGGSSSVNPNGDNPVGRCCIPFDGSDICRYCFGCEDGYVDCPSWAC